MKTLLQLLIGLAPVVLIGADSANDVLISQRKTDNSGNIQRNIPAAGAITSAATFRSQLGIAPLVSPAFTTPDIGAATGVSLALTGKSTASEFFTTPVAGTTGTTNALTVGEIIYFATFVNATTTTLTLPVGPSLGDNFFVWINGANGSATLTTSATVYRVGDSSSGTVLTPNQVAAANAKHKLTFTFDGSNWWYNDTFSAALNLAGSGTVTGLLPVANGGTGTATPALVQGTNVTITGTWPNQTINSSSASTGANPTGTTGLTAVNGSASTFLRSDGAPPLSQAITPTWTNLHTFSTGITSTAGTNSFAPFVDSVDGTTPLNNINQVVAAGTAYTMTNAYGSLTFGTTSPILTIANAGTYAVYVDVQLNLVGATYATYDSATIKLRRTNNTAADLAGSTFGTFIPTITTITAIGPYLHVGPIKYQTTNTNDTITVQGVLGTTPAAGSVTATACTITAIRAY